MREYLSKMCMEIVKEVFAVIIEKSVLNNGRLDRLEVKAITKAYASFNVVMGQGSSI